MADEKRLKARVVHKHKTEAEWHLDVYNGDTLRIDAFIPYDGELIIFDPDKEHPNRRFKFGDGTTNVIDLPFTHEAELDELSSAISAEQNRAEKIEQGIEKKLDEEIARARKAEESNAANINKNAQAIADEQERAEAVEKKNAEDIKRIDVTLKNAIENDGEGIDSIKELAVWFEEHGTEAAEMAKAIQQNAKAIQKNANAISDNTESIQHNTEDIQKNTEDIQQNAKAIENNAKNIQSNTQSIEENTEAITKLRSDLDGLDRSIIKEVDVLPETGEPNYIYAVNNSQVSGHTKYIWVIDHWEELGSNSNEIPENLIEILDNKVDKIKGKGLSTNDFTDDYKNKLDSFEIDDENNITSEAIISAKDYHVDTTIDIRGTYSQVGEYVEDYATWGFVITSALPIVPGTLSFYAGYYDNHYVDDGKGNIYCTNPENYPDFTTGTVDYEKGLVSHSTVYGMDPDYNNITYQAPKLSKASVSDNIIDLQENINNVKSNSVQYLSGTKNINADIVYAKDIRIEERKKIVGTYRTEQQDVWSSRDYYISSELPIIPGTFYANLNDGYSNYYCYDDGKGNIKGHSDFYQIDYNTGYLYISDTLDRYYLENINYYTYKINPTSVSDNLLKLNNNKVDKVEGKQLSTNDFTNEYKNKLDRSASIIKSVKKLPENGEDGYIYVIDDRNIVSETYGFNREGAYRIITPEPFIPGKYEVSVDLKITYESDDTIFGDLYVSYIDLSGNQQQLNWGQLNDQPRVNIEVSKFDYITVGYAQGTVEGIIELDIYSTEAPSYTEYIWVNNTWEVIGTNISEHPIRAGEGEGSVIISDLSSTAQAKGKFSLSQGYYTHSNGNYTHSEGNGGYAIGDYSHNEGYRTRTNELASHAEGQESIADGRYSHAEGKSTNAVGYSAHSEGMSTVAVGNHSHSEGANTKTIGQASHAEGNNTKTIGLYSHAEGQFGAAVGESAHIEGWSYYIPEDGYNKYAEEIGMSSITSISDVSAPELEKVWRVPETKTGKAPEWRFAVAHGKFSHVEGENGLAIGPFTHTEGHMNVAKGIGSHAEGIYTETVGKQSHSEGSNTSTQGRASHAEGIRTIASGTNTHTEGAHSIAGSTTIGEIYNKSGKPLFRENSYSATTAQANYVSGTITANDKDNGLIITLSNNSFFSTHHNSIIVLDGNTYKTYVSQILSYDSNTKQLVLANDTTGLPVGRAVRVFTTYTGLPSEDFNKIVEYTESNLCTTIKLDKVFIGNEASELLLKVGSNYYIAHVLSADWSNEDFTFITIDRLITEITNNVSALEIHIAENEVTGAHAEGHGTWAASEYSHSEGSNTVARAIGSHAEGKQSITMGEYCHAEGSDTKAGGHWTHTEGSGTYTEGYASHAEGVSTKAIASPSHAEGTGTIADEVNLTVVGKYNVPKGNRFKNALFIVGNGSSASATSDAFRVFTDGTVETSKITMLPDGTIKTPYVTIDANFSTSGVPAKEWLNEKWILFGDSLTASTSINGTNMNGKRYFELIAEKTGITIDNKAISGTGYKRQSDEKTGNTSGVAANAFWNVASTLEASDTDSPVITLFGSGNDLLHFSNLGSSTDTDTTTICGCINKTLDTIYEKLPLARVCVVTPTPWKNSEPNKITCHMSQYVDKLIEICHLRGIPCLDLYHNSALRPQDDIFRASAYCEDAGTHPNAVGHKLIAPRFKAMLDTLIL